jgi:hypothetical protein
MKACAFDRAKRLCTKLEGPDSGMPEVAAQPASVPVETRPLEGRSASPSSQMGRENARAFPDAARLALNGARVRSKALLQ